MPTIGIDLQDFNKLIGKELDKHTFAKKLDLVKGELKGIDENGNLRVELCDGNRPDLWSTEGIARQVRIAEGNKDVYSFFNSSPKFEICVDLSVKSVRPFVGAFIARGNEINERFLTQLIQTQEKLAEHLGRKRVDCAIGIYNADKIKFPVYYHTVDPKTHSYVPLGYECPMRLIDILNNHPKGVQYGGIFSACKQVPLLIDDKGVTLSMPPIVNSRDIGEVVTGCSNLFVEATGTKLDNMILALNILACDLADRGAQIERVSTLYPYETLWGYEVILPFDMHRSVDIAKTEFSRVLGIEVKCDQVARALEFYGCNVRIDDEYIHVALPPTRIDYLHPVDAIEDFAIARGFDTFAPSMPRDFTPGKRDSLSVLEDKARDVMIGMGYEEIISNILVSHTTLREHMNIKDESLVEVANRMNENYSVLRDAVFPCLLQTESASNTAAYPHRLFETGEVVIFDPNAKHGSRTELHLGALIVHGSVTLSEIYADLDFLLHTLVIEWSLEQTEHPSFLDGRAARVLIDSTFIGWLGEVHPRVLESWGIAFPAACFELRLNSLL